MEQEGRANKEDAGAASACVDPARAMAAVIDHRADVARYCRRFLNDDADGDDISQTVFVEAFQALERCSQARDLRAWLLGIARHRCLDRLRERRRSFGHAVEGSVARSPDPREHRALFACLAQLDSRSRELLMLRFFDELSYEEISARTADSPGALRIRVSRALAELRSLFLLEDSPSRRRAAA